MCGVIVLDAESIGLLVSDVMPICMIIALDIVMTLRGSINCSTVICSLTVILAILREASSEHYWRINKFGLNTLPSKTVVNPRAGGPLQDNC